MKPFFLSLFLGCLCASIPIVIQYGRGPTCQVFAEVYQGGHVVSTFSSEFHWGAVARAQESGGFIESGGMLLKFIEWECTE